MIINLIEEFSHFQKDIAFPEYQNNRTLFKLGNIEKVDISYDKERLRNDYKSSSSPKGLS